MLSTKWEQTFRYLAWFNSMNLKLTEPKLWSKFSWTSGAHFTYATARFLHFSFGLIHIPPRACAEADRALIKQQRVLAARFPGRTILQAVAWQSAGVKKKLFLPRCYSQLHVERERERSQEVKWTPDTLRLICTDFSCAVCRGISLPPKKTQSALFAFKQAISSLISHGQGRWISTDWSDYYSADFNQN